MIFRDKIGKMAEKYRDKVGTVCGGREYTYRFYDESSNAMARYLNALGLQKSDRFALLSRNSHYHRQMLLTAGKSGFVWVPVNARFSADEIVRMIHDAEVKVLIISQEFMGMVKGLKSRLSTVEHYVCIDRGHEGYAYLEDETDKYSKEDLDTELTEDDMLWFQYSSGTTGLPKAAVHTQRSGAAIGDLEDLPQLANFCRTDSIALQYYSSYTFAGVGFDLMYALAGVRVMIQDKFDPVVVMKTIEEEKITITHVFPATLSMIVNSPEFGKFDLSSLECITYGGAPMPTDVLVKGIKAIGPIFFQDYACSEASMMSALNMEDHVIDGSPEQTKRLTSCGKFIAGIDTRILDTDGREVGPNVMGELTVKSDAVMKEYWKMPEETAEALKDGRYYTGDIGVYDEDGFIYLLDRKKDMIISGGFNIYPAEIENVLMEHPAVHEAAVVGIPDDLWGEAICAHVVLYEGQKVAEEELIGFAKEKLAGYKKPKIVKFVDSIPRTAVGKIKRKDIRTPYWEGRARKI